MDVEGKQKEKKTDNEQLIRKKKNKDWREKKTQNRPIDKVNKHEKKKKKNQKIFFFNWKKRKENEGQYKWFYFVRRKGVLYNYRMNFYINPFSLIIFYRSVWLGFELFGS